MGNNEGPMYEVTSEEDEAIEVLLEGGDYKISQWEKEFLGNMQGKEYITRPQRNALDEVLEKYGVQP